MEQRERSPFIKTGVTFAFFQIEGRMPVERERLNSFVREGDSSAAHSFRIWPDTLFGPMALLQLMVDSKRWTSGMLSSTSLMLPSVRDSSSARSGEASFGEKFD